MNNYEKYRNIYRNYLTFTLGDKGTYTVINKELYFLDYFSKEWESFNKDYAFILTEEDMQTLKKHIGSFEINKN